MSQGTQHRSRDCSRWCTQQPHKSLGEVRFVKATVLINKHLMYIFVDLTVCGWCSCSCVCVCVCVVYRKVKMVTVALGLGLPVPCMF